MDEHATCVAVLPDGKLLVGGYVWQGGTDFDLALARLTSDGDIDPGFDCEGGHSYDPAFPTFSDVTYLAPGHGLWLRLSEPVAGFSWPDLAD